MQAWIFGRSARLWWMLGSVGTYNWVEVVVTSFQWAHEERASFKMAYSILILHAVSCAILFSIGLRCGGALEYACIRSTGTCWKKCCRCCRPNTRCPPGVCHDACYARGCKVIVTPPPKPSLKPSPPATKFFWACIAGLTLTCNVKCMKCCDSKGVCTLLTKVCYPRYPAGCGLSIETFFSSTPA